MNEKISPEEMLERMKAIFDDMSCDRETKHFNADLLLCIVLKQHGYDEAVKVFRDADKWYA